MTTTQRVWVLNKAKAFIEKYNVNAKFNEAQYQEMVDDIKKIDEASKYDRECQELMLSILACFDDRRQEE